MGSASRAPTSRLRSPGDRRDRGDRPGTPPPGGGHRRGGGHGRADPHVSRGAPTRAPTLGGRRDPPGVTTSMSFLLRRLIRSGRCAASPASTGPGSSSRLRLAGPACPARRASALDHPAHRGRRALRAEPRGATTRRQADAPALGERGGPTAAGRRRTGPAHRSEAAPLPAAPRRRPPVPHPCGHLGPRRHHRQDEERGGGSTGGPFGAAPDTRRRGAQDARGARSSTRRTSVPSWSPPTSARASACSRPALARERSR